MLWASSPTTVVVERGDLRPDGRMLEEQAPEDQQVVVVDEVSLGLALGEVGVDACEVGLELDEPRELLGEDAGHRHLGVHVAGVDVVEGLLPGKPLLGVSVAELGARELEEVGGVSLVHDREVAGEARGRPEPAEEAVGRSMESAAVDLAAGATDQLDRSSQHLLGGAPGEGEEEDPFSADA